MSLLTLRARTGSRKLLELEGLIIFMIDCTVVKLHARGSSAGMTIDKRRTSM